MYDREVPLKHIYTTAVPLKHVYVRAVPLKLLYLLQKSKCQTLRFRRRKTLPVSGWILIIRSLNWILAQLRNLVEIQFRDLKNQDPPPLNGFCFIYVVFLLNIFPLKVLYSSEIQ